VTHTDTHASFPTIFPQKEEYLRTVAATTRPQLLWTKLVADLDTPVSALLKLQQSSPFCFLLESVEGGETRGRYSIIGLQPDFIWKCHGHDAFACHDTTTQPLQFTPCAQPSIPSLKALIDDTRLEIPDNLPPMAAGLIGYHGYDMIKLIENIPSANPDPIDIPDAWLMRPSVTLIFDGRDGVIYLTAPVWTSHLGSTEDASHAYEVAAQRLRDTLALLEQPLDHAARYREEHTTPLNFISNQTRESYYAMVNKAKEHIRAGDIFQVVPSQRFHVDFDLPPIALYRALRFLNPSPFLFYLQMDGFSLVGSSPEILVRVRDDKITIRPLAGTRWRGATKEEDNALEQELLGDPKELAEHLMLLDLGRNDVGKCATIGSVNVTEQMVVERYSHVMHIVSNVEGMLDRTRYDCFDALMSGFPAGTVSGAPKIRAMEIIDELEPEKRSFYAGCVGYFSANGSMDTCITLRTGLLKDGKLYIQAGGGLVADSGPEAEYQESCNKAKALMRAAEFAVNFTE